MSNKKGAGLLALFNEGAAQKGLALILYDGDDKDSLALATVDEAGRVKTLKSLKLGADILDNVWYRLTMDVVVSGDDLTVTGRVFGHTVPANPNGTLGAQVGGTLATPKPLSLTALGLQGSGEVGIVASAIKSDVDSSVTNFEVRQDSLFELRMARDLLASVDATLSLCASETVSMALQRQRVVTRGHYATDQLQGQDLRLRIVQSVCGGHGVVVASTCGIFECYCDYFVDPDDDIGCGDFLARCQTRFAKTYHCDSFGTCTCKTLQ